VIHPAFSFGFCDVQDGDEIIVAEVTKGKEPVGKTFRGSRIPSLSRMQEHSDNIYLTYGIRPDLESLKQALQELCDPRFANVAAKIRDAYFRRIEGNLMSHWRLMLRFEAANESGSEIATGSVGSNLSCADQPSEGALPRLWKERRKKFDR
jgi:hypothetical protein